MYLLLNYINHQRVENLSEKYLKARKLTELRYVVFLNRKQNSCVIINPSNMNRKCIISNPSCFNNEGCRYPEVAPEDFRKPSKLDSKHLLSGLLHSHLSSR